MTESPKAVSPLRRIAKLAAAVILILAGLSAVIVYARRKPAPEKAPAIQARLELAAGEVRIDHGDGEVRAVSGMPLLANAKIRTEKGARALVRLPDGAVLFMRADSALSLSSAAVRLERGEYFLNAPPSERQSLTHELGDLAVSAADAALSLRRQGALGVVYVARGMATLTAKGGRVEVSAGEQASVQGSAAPRVAPLSFWDDWTGGMADAKSGAAVAAGSGAIFGVDEHAAGGSPARRLTVSRQAVRAVVRDGLSETEVDQTFFNPGEHAVEGWYWFTVPERASITGFAVETNGVLIDGEFTESREAKAQYDSAKASGHSPAILEWVDNKSYRARIFPVPAGGQRRVVLRYIELRPTNGEKLEYVYPFGAGDVRIGELSLSVDLGEAGKKMKIATLADARIEQAGRLVTMRRSGYTPRAPFQVEAVLPEKRPVLSLSRFATEGDSADYVMARYTPDFDWSRVKPQRADLVLVVDTSAGGDEASRGLKLLTTEAILRALSDDDRFALLALDVRPRVLHPKSNLSPASDAEISRALEALAEHASGGATDLAAMFDVALGRLHGAEQPAVVYVGDGIATSGERTGEQLIERLRRAFGTSRARLFTVAAGAEADSALLSELARAGGGQALRVNEADQTTARALELAAAIKVPTITELELDLGAGLDEPFVSAGGKVSRGEEVVVLARTHHDFPEQVKVRGRLGAERFEKKYDVERDTSVLGEFVPKLWAAEYVRRLLGASDGVEAERGRIVALGLEYGIVTPFTSILALESEDAYARMGIPRKGRSRLRGVKLSLLGSDDERRIAVRASAVPAAPLFFGCSKSEAPASQSESRNVGASPPAEMAKTEAPAPPMAAPAPVEEEAEKAAEPAPDLAKGAAAGYASGRGAADGFDEPQAGASAPGPGSAGLGLGSIGSIRAGAGGGGRVAAKPSAPAARERAARRDENAWSAAVPVLGTCSDVAGRPLAERMLLWRKRLRAASTAPELAARYDAARRACELSDWRVERVFLELMQVRIRDASSAEFILRHFEGRRDVQKFLAKLILRRAVDPALVSAVERALFGGQVDWADVDLKLQAVADVDARILKLREYMARAPEDPNGGMRLVRLLAQADRRDEALTLGRKLRDQGLMTPRLAQELGDVLTRAGLEAEAVRTYSEIVEFDPDGRDSRRLLGDIFLGHGWYEPAYRQYRTMTDAAPDDALARLRLAAAAAGSGRIDEALRLERHVATSEGTPGPSDPRRWARLLSATRLARLIDKPPPLLAGEADSAERRKESMKRELKELQLFSGPGVLRVLTWEQLDADVTLEAQSGAAPAAVGDSTDAAPAGLSALALSVPEAARVSSAARLRSLARTRELPLLLHEITWDGKDFGVRLERRSLPPGQAAVEL